MSIHVGDEGTQIDVSLYDDGVAVTVASGDTVQFRFRKPDGSVVVKNGTIVSAPSSTVRYVLQTGDIDQAGRWLCQVYLDIVASSWTGYTSRFAIDVDPILA